MSNILSKITHKVPTIPGFRMNVPLVRRNLNGIAGIEIEVEGRQLPYVGGFAKSSAENGVYWTSVADGSLRGESQEYLLTGPCDFNEVQFLVENLYTAFKDYNTTLSLSNRCSTHVHLNIGGLKINQITSLISLWYTFETCLIEWCGIIRKSNHFCLSAKDSSETVASWVDYLRTGQRGNFRERDGLKYSALNLLPIWQKGSVEIRVAPAFETAEPVIQWTKFLIAMREYCLKKFVNPMDLASALSEIGGRALFEDICSYQNDDHLTQFFNSVMNTSDDIWDSFDHKCMEDFRRVQSLIYLFPWTEWMPLIDKTYIPNPFIQEERITPLGRNLPGRRLEALEVGDAVRINERIFNVVDEF